MDSEKKGTTAPIRGKVARILTSREVAINLGSDDGVIPGMYFDILHEEGQEIQDPDTGDILGNIDRPKIRVKVTHVHGKLSLAATFKKKRTNRGGQYYLEGLSKALMPPRWVTEYETFKTEEKTWENLDERDSFVKTGDPVVQVLVTSDDNDMEQGGPVGQLTETV